MDLSDGLAGDLPKLAQRERPRGACRDRPPAVVGRAAAVGEIRSRRAIGRSAAGDDYELLLAVPPPRYDELAARGGPIELNVDRDR